MGSRDRSDIDSWFFGRCVRVAERYRFISLIPGRSSVRTYLTCPYFVPTEADPRPGPISTLIFSGGSFDLPQFDPLPFPLTRFPISDLSLLLLQKRMTYASGETIMRFDSRCPLSIGLNKGSAVLSVSRNSRSHTPNGGKEKHGFPFTGSLFFDLSLFRLCQRIDRSPSTEVIDI